MKKVLPFIFPLAALIIVIFLAFRWYSMRGISGQIGPVNEGVSIENLTQEQRERVMRGTKDSKTVVMEPANDQSLESGDIRYDIQNGQVLFSVDADLSPLTEGYYQVWLKSGDQMTPAFQLELSKGGYTGSAAVKTEALPVEVVVSKELKSDQTIEEVVLRAVIAQ